PKQAPKGRVSRIADRIYGARLFPCVTMCPGSMRKTVVVLLLILCCAAASVPAVQVFSTNSVWRFRRGHSEASSPITSGRISSYNDTAAGFTDASAPFWYGDPYPGGTQLTDMQNSYSCI